MFLTGHVAVPLAADGEWFKLLFYGTLLAVALLVAAAVIEVVRRWGRKGAQPMSSSDQLAHYRALYKRGEISQEEFDRLRAVLGGEVRRAVSPPAPPPAAPAPNLPDDAPPAPPDGVRPA